MKLLAKETAIYGMPSIVGKFLNWTLVSLYTRVLANTAEYGIVTNLYGWTALLLVILTYGMETGFFRFVNKKEEQEPMRLYATTIYSVAATSALFIACSLSFLGPISSLLGYEAHPEYLGMLFFIVAVDAFCCIPFAYLRYRNKAARFAAIKIAKIFLEIFLNIFFLLICPRINASQPGLIDWFYSPDYGVGYIFISNILSTLATLLLLLPDVMPGLRMKPDIGRLRKMLAYSFPILIFGIAGIFNQTADKILFPFLFEDKAYANSQLGVYGACFKIAVVMVMAIQAFRYAYEPFIFAKNKNSDIKSTNAEAMRFFIVFASAIFIGVMFYLDIFKHLVAEEYYSGLAVVPIVMLGEMFFGVYFNLSVWYKLTDQTKWGAYFSLIGCAVTVATIALFVPRYGFIACAWASFASNLIMMLLSYFVGQSKYPMPYDLRSALFFCVLAAACYCAGTLPQIGSVALRLAYRTAILAFFLGIAGFNLRKHIKGQNI